MKAKLTAATFGRLPYLFSHSVRLARRFVIATVVAYGLFLLLGFLPAAVQHKPPGDEFVTIFVRSNDIHTDIVLPVYDKRSNFDWRKVFPPSDVKYASAAKADYIAIGWGDRGFFINTRTWDDLQVSTVAYAALWPSETVLHADYLFAPKADKWMHEVRISPQQHQKLIRYIESFIAARDKAGAAIPASDVTYGNTDRFYVATGNYHLCSTCNQWTGAGLRTAEQPCGIWTPTKTHVVYWLPEQAE